MLFNVQLCHMYHETHVATHIAFPRLVLHFLGQGKENGIKTAEGTSAVECVVPHTE